MVRDRLDGTMAMHSKGNSSRITSTARERTLGKMAANSMATGNKIRCTDLAFSRGPTVEDTKDNILMTTSKASVPLHGQTDENTLARGKSAKWTVRALTFLRRVANALDSGRTVSEFNGSRTIPPIQNFNYPRFKSQMTQSIEKFIHKFNIDFQKNHSELSNIDEQL